MARPLPPGLDRLLRDWLPRQRWFPAKGHDIMLSDVGLLELSTGDDAIRIEHRLIAVTTAGAVQIVQVPLVLRALRDGEPGSGAGHLADLDGSAVHDGPQDAAYVAALLRLIGGGDRAEGTCSATGHTTGRMPHDDAAPSQVLAGEQSNTSIIVSSRPQPLMIKLFRVITAGANPDVEVTSALTEAGVESVAKVAGWVDGSWTDPAGEPAAGHLAVSAEFVPDSQDAWRQAVDALRRNADFTTAAAELGAATARVHSALAERLGTFPATDEHLADLVNQLRGRVDWAIREVPELVDLGDRLRAHAAGLDRLQVAEVGALQRIHGDYHLGQVLHSAARGWILLDFEGEPLRPLADRIRPDVPARDVVGMVRSFDYAAGFVTKENPGQAEQATAWAQRCRQAFLASYERTHDGGAPARTVGPLFDALLLDKALYEVVYEARNRPDWIDIPRAAVAAVLHR